jgi:hypothetical protein
MARRGRPKKAGGRFPSGRLRPESAGVTYAALQRLRSLGTNQILETQVGRLLFLDELTLDQARAAWHIAEIYGRHDRAMGRRRAVASPSYEVGRGRDTGLVESEDEAERVQRARRAYARLQAALAACPRGVKPALEELCIEDRACPAGWMPRVRLALDLIAIELGIRRRPAR